MAEGPSSYHQPQGPGEGNPSVTNKKGLQPVWGRNTELHVTKWIHKTVMWLAASSAPIAASGETGQDPHTHTEGLQALWMPWDAVKHVEAIL